MATDENREEDRSIPELPDLAYLEGLKRLTRDMKKAAVTLKEREVRYLVDSYYSVQKTRVRLNNQIKALRKSGEPHELVLWLYDQIERFEKDVKAVLASYSPSKRIGRWAESITGIGPVISSGLQANLTLRPWRCQHAMSTTKKSCHSDKPCSPQCKFEEIHTVGHIWKFAGLLPPELQPWEKGEKRPWNASLKTLSWKVGESFVKFCNKENDHYGKVYIDRKALEFQRNESGQFTTQAKQVLEKRNIRVPEVRKWYAGEIAPFVSRWWRENSTVDLKVRARHTPTMKQLQGKAPKGQEVDYAKLVEAIAEAKGKGVTIEPIPMLSPGHIQSRAKRYAVKLFLAHWFQVSHAITFGVDAPKPYVVEHLGHADIIRPPNWPMD